MVEGFPRSGNTFTVFAIQHLTDDEIHIASHVHHPSQFIKGSRLGLPTVVVIRPPIETLASYLIAGPHATASMVLREYDYYHRCVSKHAASLLLATFEQVTTDLASVIRRVNERWHTDFPEATPDGDATEAIFERIDAQYEQFHADEDGMLARPDPDRRELNEQLRTELARPVHAARLARCNQVYFSLEQLTR